MDTDDRFYWQDLEQQAGLLHERLHELFDSGPVQLLTNQLKIPNTPEAKLAQYLHVLQSKHALFIQDPSEHEKSRRDRIIQQFCIQPEQFPEKYFENVIQRYNNDGINLIDLNNNQRKALMASINTDQTKRLKQWVNHLNSESDYPIWFRYFVLSNIVKLKEFDTKKGTFPRRSNTSTANFPEVNPEVIRNIYRHITEPDFHNDKKRMLAEQYLRMETRDQHAELPERHSNFAKLHEFWTHDFLRQVAPDDLFQTEGQWVLFDGPHLTSELTKSISGYNTGWCIANMGQSLMYLTHGDILVYFTPIKSGEMVIPRISIRLEHERVREVIGRGPNQSIEEQLLDATLEKLQELNSGPSYFKKLEDTRKLTKIMKKIEEGEPLAREDLVILYEIEQPLTSFGLRKDPRIANAIENRDIKDDMAFLFGCEPDEVAVSPEELAHESVVCVFKVNWKTQLTLDEYPNVIAIVGDARFERMDNKFPNLAFVSGFASTGNHMEKLAVVGGTLSHVNSRQNLEFLTKVGGHAILTSTHCEFPALETVGGNLTANYSSSLFPALRNVKGGAHFTCADIAWLPQDLVIAGPITGTLPPTRVDLNKNPMAL